MLNRIKEKKMRQIFRLKKLLDLLSRGIVKSILGKMSIEH